MSNSILEPALEKGVYSAFRQKEISWRPANIGRQVIYLSNLQLPTNSILHVVDRFLEDHVTDITMDPQSQYYPTLVTNEKFQVYLWYLTDILGQSGPLSLLPITDKFRYRPAAFATEIRNSFHGLAPHINRPPSLASMLSRGNILPVINYNPVLTAQPMGGTFLPYRHFDILFRTILNTIHGISANKQQYLQIPLSHVVYTKNQFALTADKITYQTVRIKNDPSFFFLIHLVNFVNKAATTSYFSQLPQEDLDRLNVILTSGDKAVIYNLGELKAIVDARQDNAFFQQVIRHVNTLKLAGHADVDVSELDDKAYDKVVDEMAPKDDIDTPPEAAKTPLSTVKEISPHDTSSVIPAQHPEEPKTPESTSTPQDVTPASRPVAVREVTQPLQKRAELAAPIEHPDHLPLQDVPVTHPDPNSLISSIDRNAYQTIMGNQNLTDEQKKKTLLLSQKYKDCFIDGVRIEDHLNQVSEPPISNAHLTYLEGKIPDSSMLDSTVVDLDKHYVDHVMAKDLASVAASMVQHGMFLVATEQHDQITQLDKIRHYKLVYEDMNGRRHTVQFKYPIVNDAGTIVVNGIESRMIKQQVNLPICKISPWRVSLASNYNKTLVERIAVKAHNFSSWITKYILAVVKADVGLTVGYGALVPSAIALPYDYTSVGKRFASLSFASYHLFFDYPNRFNNFEQTPPYYEEGSTFSRRGSDYDLTAMLKDPELHKLPLIKFNVSDLAWINPKAQMTEPEDEQRIKDAYLGAPILVTLSEDGQYDTIDGFHRLVKAMRYDVKFLIGRLVPPELIAKYRIGPSMEGLTPTDTYIKKLQSLEQKYGVYCGYIESDAGNDPIFFGYDNQLRFLSHSDFSTLITHPLDKFGHTTTMSITDLLFSVFSQQVTTPKQLSEWTELKILDKNFPIIFILGFVYGLKKTLDHIGIKYNFYPSGEKFSALSSTIVVPFQDGNLVFDRYPLHRSFIAAGLLKFNTKLYPFDNLNRPDGYYTLLQDAQISMNYLKGISDFFKLFIDPITRDVLLRMHEPTDVAGLLIRATEMLSTENALPAASMANHRLRGYERFNSTLYNEMSRQFASFSRQRGNRKVYSINPDAVFYRLVSDQTLRIVDEINPIEDVKDRHSATYAGSGGRTAQSFVIDDRNYPEDAAGVISECTPDNGKVALNVYVSANPLIANVRGMFDLQENRDPRSLEPSQLLSVTTLLMPGATQDD